MSLHLKSIMLSIFSSPKFFENLPIFVAIFAILATLAVIVFLYQNLTTRRHRINQSLEGKVYLITGGTAGIGKECVLELAKAGAAVHMLARDVKKAELLADEIRAGGNKNIFIHYVDLSNLSTISKFAKTFLATDTPVHVLINNAGLFNWEKKKTVDGFEETFQANYLGHFFLTNLLLERLTASGPSRIINVSSIAFQWTDGFDISDLNWNQRPYQWLGAYAWTKLEMILWTRELARKIYGTGVTVNVLHPGGVRTSILRNYKWWSWWTPSLILLMPLSISAYLGAQTILYLATSNQVTNISGQYFFNCRPASLTNRALDDDLAKKLWDESEKLTSY